ncbi:hypothetical protein KVH15_08755 [Streptomyces olivaceus]|uniref:hypothetical protein n=1 Tax=Streptomyces olivaceus TaxID=47716 RepID=UPI001CC8F1AB|nr:hypothetical protein [Streptomyces olivaceus]MBZ6081133.1 hypothetical protein [Streptomyces olivaceus]
MHAETGDESRRFSKDRKTGKVAKTPVTENSYVLYSTGLDRNADDVWRTSQIVSTRGATQCKPYRWSWCSERPVDSVASLKRSLVPLRSRQ